MQKLLTSKFFYAVVAFCALSMMASSLRLWEAKPTEYPYHSWTSWAIDDFLAKKKAPQMVFLGSSLMLVPLSGVDADVYKQKLDGAQHHYSRYFEQEFGQQTGCKVDTFNFALPGEMPSDAYLITDFLLKGDKRPDVIVYGVGPRDFMDNLLPSPAATDPYRFLQRFGDVSPLASRTTPEFVERMNYELGRVNYFYGERVDISRQWNELVSKVMNEALPATKPLSREAIVKLVPEHKPFQLEKNEAFFRPASEAELAAFTDNLEEYKKRYNKLKMPTFLSQMQFMSDLLKTARERGTHVVVVAMPITDLNRELIPDSAWELYRSNLQNIASSGGASFVDFSESSCFNRKDFMDTVHLHSRGGRKFFDLLIEQLNDNETLKAALRSDGKVRVAEQQQPKQVQDGPL
jgi:hypothetical protein